MASKWRHMEVEGDYFIKIDGMGPSLGTKYSFILGPSSVHNWQNWKSVSLSCHFYEIHKVQNVGLRSSNNILKFHDSLCVCTILVQFHEKSIFCQ